MIMHGVYCDTAFAKDLNIGDNIRFIDERKVYKVLAVLPIKDSVYISIAHKEGFLTVSQDQAFIVNIYPS